MTIKNILGRVFRKTERNLSSFQIPPVRDSGQPKFTLTAIAIVKDEVEILPEWIAFHQSVGFEHFYVYDNGSTDGTIELLARYRESGLVTVIPWPHFVEKYHIQSLAYAHALSTFGPDSKWMAFFDADEFFFCPSGEEIKSILSERPRVPGFLVFRHTYGRCGHLTKPKGLVIENFLESAAPPAGSFLMRGWLTAPKSIVQPRLVRATQGSHFFKYRDDPSCGYTEKGEAAFRKKAVNGTASRLRINHYYSRDGETFASRRSGGVNAANNKVEGGQYLQIVQTIESMSVRDEAILRFAEATKENLFLPTAARQAT
jgi:hypothetical protein